MLKGKNQIWTLKIESEALTEEVDSIANGLSNILGEFESLSNTLTFDIESNASSIESLSNTLEGISNEVYTDIDTLQIDLSSLSNSVIDSASKITALQEANQSFNKNDVEFSSNLTVRGTFLASGPAILESNADISGTLTVGDDTTVSSNLVVHGTTTVHGKTMLQSNLDIGGLLNVTNNTRLESNLEVLGDTSIIGSLTVNGILNAADGMNAGSILPLSNEIFDLGSSNLRWRDLFISGNTIDMNGTRIQVDPITRDLRISDTTNNLRSIVAREIQIGDSKTDSITGRKSKSVLRRNETGRMQFQTLSDTEDSSSFTVQEDVATDLTVDGDAEVRKTLNVDGDTILGRNMSVDGNAIVQGTVTVQGIVDLNDRVNVTGQLNAMNDIIVNSNLSVEGSTTLGSNVVVVGTTVLQDALTVDKNLLVSGTTELTSNLTVQGVTTMTDAIIDGNLRVSGTTTFINSETLSIKDPVIQLGEDITKEDRMDRGITFLLGTGTDTKKNFFGWDRSRDSFILLKNVEESRNNIIGGGDIGNIQAGTFLGSNAILSHNVNVNGTMDVTGDATFDSNVNMIGPLNLSKDMTVEKNIEVIGSAIFDSNVGIGIGLSNVQDKLHVGGSIRATGNIIAEETVVSQSDRRLKNNIEPIQNPYDIVKGMNGVLYSLKRDQVEPVKRYCGLIAQDVQKVLPEVVETQTDGMLSVAYGNIIGVLVEAVKNLIEEVEELKGK